MAGPAVSAFLYLMQRAFDRSEHSLLRNLDGTSAHEWDALIPGQPFGRSIGFIAWHTAEGKRLYWDHAFGSRTLTGGITSTGVHEPRRLLPEVVAHARQWQERWLASVEALADEELELPTTAHWAEVLSLRQVMAAMIEHDLYHAGEINHLRAVLSGADRPPG